MVSPGTLTVPRRLIPALMLLATHGTPDPSALAELERSGVVAGGSLSSDVAGLLAVMTDPELVISVEVTTRDGSRLSTITVPASQVTSCCFGGADLRTLYITTARYAMDAAALDAEPLAGATFASEPDVTGLPTTAFAG